MARYAQSQANYCARVGRLVHSDRFAYEGGENLAQGGRHFSPRDIVNCWLGSKQGHREYLLDFGVEKAGVGIAKSRGNTYVAWAFSSSVPDYPDCPYYPHRKIYKNYSKPKRYNVTINIGNIAKVVLVILLTILSLFGIILGSHGLFVYFNSMDIYAGASTISLFTMVEMPSELQSIVLWMTDKGLQSWLAPTLFVVGGILGGIIALILKIRKWRGQVISLGYKIIFRKLIQATSIFGFVLSAHGIYAWAHQNDWYLAVDVISGKVQQGDLFFIFRVPVIDKAVSWMSYEGVHSLFVPILVAVVSYLLWKYQYEIV